VKRARAAAMLVLSSAACGKAQTAPLYEKVPVQRRDVVVTIVAQGIIQPALTFSVKSKAWGEIISQPVQTGDEVKKGQLLTTIDPRIPQSNLTQAQASVDKARAQLKNAAAQFQRSEVLYRSNSLAETAYDAAQLAHVTAQAAVVTAEANLQTAKDAMDDTHVRAPIGGTVLELDAVRGTVISSPTLGGGTVILKMANLDTVQDSALVIETDIGRVQAGMAAGVSVDAYPNRVFEGTILKVMPQAQVVQNTTMFPVLINVPNPGHPLKRGMHTEVRIRTGRREGVLAVPNAALRTPRDVNSAVGLLGLDSQTVAREISAAAAPPAARAADAASPAPQAGRAGGASGGAGGGGGGEAGAGATVTLPSGRTVVLPPGVSPEQLRAALAKMASGAVPTPTERALLGRVFGRSAGAGTRQSRNNQSYVVFALRGGKVIAAQVKTGLSDQDYIEVTSGLEEGDTVLVLPTASLVQAQQQFRQRFTNVTGGGLPGLRQQPQSGGSR
jgi:RND family efflux transporter MFP subunit